MLKVHFPILIFRMIPETLIIFLLINSLSKIKINKARYIASCLITSILIFLVRILPIHFGIHFIINIIVIIFISILINKIPINKAIAYSMASMMLLSVCEWINLFILEYILKLDIGFVFSSSYTKLICFSPSLILLLIVVLLIRKYVSEHQRFN